MPFGLKNAGATYQRLMDKAFESQIGQNIDVYVDDLVVKSYTEAEMMRDIEETFRTLRKVNMKLNPKMLFGLAEGMFLGYVVTPEGIKLCSDKTAAVLQLPSPQTIKEIQSLNGKLASLNRFLSKSAEKYLPLFQTLKKCIKKSDFHWNAEAEQAFKQLKQHLSEFPLLVAPKPKEELIIYLSVIYGTISAVLMTESGTAKNVGQRTDLSRFSHRDAGRKPTNRTSGRNLTGAVDAFHGRLIMSSNNEAEYEALITGLRIAARMGVKNVHVSVDSKLVANQVLGTYVAKEDNMVKEGDDNNDKGGRTDLDDTDSVLLKRRNSPRRQEGGQKTLPQGPTIRVNGGNSLHAVVPYAVVKMCWTALGGWIEAKAMATITGGQVKKFVWDNIVCRFGIPGEIVSDNGKQFSDNPFKDWRDKLNITQRFASVKHPQSNGVVERANQSLGEGIKSRLGEGNKKWVEELLHVLWAHRTMIKSSDGDTPFSLTYGTEAVIPTDIRMPTYRTATVDVVNNDEELRLNLDLLKERRERAAIYEANAKSNMTNHAAASGKLGPKWEGPYEVTEALGDGAYKLRSMDGIILPRTWNIAILK
nr:reverse transcriptase domain-containing protein [Tanacetum cinerariifolium]